MRASYFDETQEQIEGLWNTLHFRKIGVIYRDDAFGAAVLRSVQTAMKTVGAEPVASASYARQTSQSGYLTDLKPVALYRRTLEKFEPGSRPNFVSLEGFVDAMVLTS